MLIVEGPDCVGKTTLCKKLLEHLPNHAYQHLSRPPIGFDSYWWHAKQMNRFIVQDRFHLGEMVYPALRNEPILNYNTYFLLDAKLRQLGGIQVLVTATPTLIYKRFEPIEQMYDLQHTLTAALMFRNLGDLLQWPRVAGTMDFVIACDEETPYVTDEQIGRILERYKSRQTHLDSILRRQDATL
jgi:hypothetical protein